MPRDYYDVLGVSRSASSEEISKAYRKLARQHHPDRNPGDKQAETTFKEIQNAYDVLSDTNKKSQYDQFGHTGPQFAGGSPGGAPGGFNFGPDGAQIDPEQAQEIFSKMFGGEGGFRFDDLLGVPASAPAAVGDVLSRPRTSRSKPPSRSRPLLKAAPWVCALAAARSASRSPPALKKARNCASPVRGPAAATST